MILAQCHISKVKIIVHTYQKSVSGSQLLTAKLDLDYILHNCCPWLKGVTWPWLKVISPRSRSKCTHTSYLCPGHNSSLPCWVWIIFHTIVVHDLRMCHDLDPKSYLQGQGNSSHIPEICIRTITLYCQIWLGWYLTYLLSMAHGLLLWGVFVLLGHV